MLSHRRRVVVVVCREPAGDSAGVSTQHDALNQPPVRRRRVALCCALVHDVTAITLATGGAVHSCPTSQSRCALVHDVTAITLLVSLCVRSVHIVSHRSIITFVCVAVVESN